VLWVVHTYYMTAADGVTTDGVIPQAFAGQVLANLTAMASNEFASKHLPGGNAVGEIDMSRINTLGGSLSLGHPFGATGVRLLTTAANRLQREQQRFALITACADGGLAHACVLERYPQ
jgi:acetyl-CoA acyltransferase